MIDCHDREIVGYEFALRGRAKEAERAMEDVCIRRFGTLRPRGPKPIVRWYKGLIIRSRRFREACRDYGLRQEFITPYTPEQNGIVELFFGSMKEECIWQHAFRSSQEAKHHVDQWIRWHNKERPHQALDYRRPSEYRARLLNQVAWSRGSTTRPRQ